MLVECALERLRGDRRRVSCSPLALRALRSYAWPGNVRELLAVLESALIRLDGERIEANHLPPGIRGRGEGAVARYRAADAPDEPNAILAALEAADGSRSKAATLLGMGRTTLWRKMKQYGMEAEQTEPDTD
jgi:transcriptional regulator of acetoin/glycerol metabolism